MLKSTLALLAAIPLALAAAVSPAYATGEGVTALITAQLDAPLPDELRNGYAWEHIDVCKSLTGTAQHYAKTQRSCLALRATVVDESPLGSVPWDAQLEFDQSRNLVQVRLSFNARTGRAHRYSETEQAHAERTFEKVRLLSQALSLTPERTFGVGQMQAAIFTEAPNGHERTLIRNELDAREPRYHVIRKSAVLTRSGGQGS